MKKYILPVLALSILIAAPVLGATTTFDFNPFGETKDIGTLLSKIINFLIYLAIPVSTILIIYAGFLYLTSAGNEQQIKTAQKALIWAIVGFAIVLIASAVPAIIQEFLYGEEPPGIEGEAGTGIGAEGEIGFETEEAAGEETAVEEETGTYKVCMFLSTTGEAWCETHTWSGIDPNYVNECEYDSDCQKFVYKVCRVSVESGEPFCKASIWYGTDPKPANECEYDSDCQPSPTTGTYKTCRKPSVGSWAWLTGNANTLYCKTEVWTGENPGDECSVLDEVCPVGTGAF